MTITVGEALGMKKDARKWKNSDKLACNETFIGVEIELENLGALSLARRQKLQSSGLWTIVKDGSLRNNGLEFIMCANEQEPLKGGDIIKALEVFQEFIDSYLAAGAEPPDTSKRTSVHVHLDVRDVPRQVLQRIILFYSIFEETFFKWSLPERYHNNYCRSISSHHDIVERLSYLLSLQNDVELSTILANGNKYDALNFLSIRNKGSLEFRLLKGTYDTSLILKWINMILSLKNAAYDETITIDSFPETMSIRGINNLIDIIFGKYGEELKSVSTQHDILHGVRIAQEILISPHIRYLDDSFKNHSSKTGSHLEQFKENVLKEIK